MNYIEPLPLIPRPEEWVQHAVCASVDPELFYRTGYEVNDQAKAKDICFRCPVRAECLEYALEHDERYGIWGGVTEAERVQIKKRRRHD